MPAVTAVTLSSPLALPQVEDLVVAVKSIGTLVPTVTEVVIKQPLASLAVSV